jgi:voltage-gated potassium channel
MDKILIYGYSKLTFELVKILQNKKYEFSIITENEQSTQNAINDGFQADQIDLSIDENLLKVGVSKDINVLFCMSEDVHINLFVILSARALDKELKIISFSTSKQDETKILLSGANSVINPNSIGTQRLFRLMQKPTLFWVMDMLLFESSDILFIEIRVKEDSPYLEIALKDLEEKIDKEILVIGLQRGEKFVFDTIKSGYHVKVGDVIILIGHKKDIKDVYI